MESRSLELKIRREREAHFLGRAKIQIRNLRLEGRGRTPDDTWINPKVVSSLIKRFAQEECQRYEPENAVPDRINEDTLNKALDILDL